LTFPRLTILDRYMLAELVGPFLFGLSAFTLIFAATSIINIGRLISETHAPLWAAIEVFLWQLPGMVVLTIPMALLLGTLLAIQRLSGESEITAMKAGGVTFLRIAAPILLVGFVLSFVTMGLQEYVVPFAQTQFTIIQNTVINRTSAFASDLNVSAPLPGGGSQTTFAKACEQNCQALLDVTLIQYDRAGHPTQIVFADRAVFEAAMDPPGRQNLPVSNRRRERYCREYAHVAGRAGTEANRYRQASSEQQSGEHEPLPNRPDHSLGATQRERSQEVHDGVPGKAGDAVCVLCVHAAGDSIRHSFASRRT
jgi:lipopolysaccharide export LptBFGC system permease protein LptF